MRKPVPLSDNGVRNLLVNLFYENAPSDDEALREKLNKYLEFPFGERVLAQSMERRVLLILHFGLYDGEQRTLKEIGSMLGMRPSLVRNRLEKAKSWLRSRFKSDS